VNKEAEKLAAEGMRGLCTAVGALSSLRDATEIPERKLRLQRMVAHLMEAVGDCPDELWLAMLREDLGTSDLISKIRTIAA
jgi:hypothetical protein